jgi:hypothetical protein
MNLSLLADIQNKQNTTLTVSGDSDALATMEFSARMKNKKDKMVANTTKVVDIMLD